MNTNESVTVISELTRMGVEDGDLLIVHCAFKSIALPGFSPQDMIRALMTAAGADGTIMMPTFTYSYSGIWNTVPFNPETTPGYLNGVLSEALRQYPGALRSGHPTYSVAAIGKYAEKITSNREMCSPLGKGSSWDEAITLGGKILLLGVNSSRNSSLHYAEVLAGLPYNHIPFRKFWGSTALMEKDGQVNEVPLAREYPACSDAFGAADIYLEERGMLRHGRIGNAAAMLMNGREVVDAVVKKLRSDPAWLLCDNIVCEPCSLRKTALRQRGLI
ncbi:MAG: AAC(3) family N-acetyltransferase [bacterium]|nr:AAC(3) family N-acetyltransferase [bacterium]